jgi:hypothetical protein
LGGLSENGRCELSMRRSARQRESQAISLLTQGEAR